VHLYAVQEYCGKDHDVFGGRFVAENKSIVIKRKIVEVLQEETADKMHDKMREWDPEGWFKSHLNYNAAFEHVEKRRKLDCDVYVQPEDCCQPWRLYPQMERWVAEEFNSVKVSSSGVVRGGSPPNSVRTNGVDRVGRSLLSLLESPELGR
jgi:hypothetical protein